MGWAGDVFFNIGFEPINHLGDVGAWDQGQSIVDVPQGSLQKLNFTVHTFKLGMAIGILLPQTVQKHIIPIGGITASPQQHHVFDVHHDATVLGVSYARNLNAPNKSTLS
jgi:hypothetical protein